MVIHLPWPHSYFFMVTESKKSSQVYTEFINKDNKKHMK